MLNDERNVFAIYVSYYVKVKLTLSGIGGELSLKLPFALVHIDQLNTEADTAATASSVSDAAGSASAITPMTESHLCDTFSNKLILEPPKIRTTALASLDDISAISKRKLVRSSTIIKDSSEDEDIEVPIPKPHSKTKTMSKSMSSDSEVEAMNSGGGGGGTSGGNQWTCVQIHNYSSSNLTKARKKKEDDIEEGEALGIQEINKKDDEGDEDNEHRKHS